MNAVAFAGVDHILAGSDYPHQIGSIELMKASIATLPISETDKDRIRAGNSMRILGL
jgi:aminocarboxymuconate-semialdehyde decarboxylase